VNDISREWVREGYFEAPVCAGLGETEDFSGIVDMPLDKVAAQAGIRGESAFEIDDRTRRERAEVCPIQCLPQEIEADGFRIERNRRQAAAVHRDTVAGSDLASE
jgi:hypothetical protein